MPDEGQFDGLLQHWKSQYLDGDDLVARQLCPVDWSEEQILLLQQRIDLLRVEVNKEIEQREPELEDALNHWRDCFRADLNYDRTAQDLCPTLPKRLLARLESRIFATKNKVLVERWEAMYRQGSNVSAGKLYEQGEEDFLADLQDLIDRRKAEIDDEREKQREIELDDALDRWQENHDEGIDRSAKDLCPDWPEEWLKIWTEELLIAGRYKTCWTKTTKRTGIPQFSSQGAKSLTWTTSLRSCSEKGDLVRHGS